MEAASIVLGTYAITASLAYSDGAWGVLYRLRNNQYIKDFGLLECSICIAFWASLTLCVAFNRLDLVFISWGATVALERLIHAYLSK